MTTMIRTWKEKNMSLLSSLVSQCKTKVIRYWPLIIAGISFSSLLVLSLLVRKRSSKDPFFLALLAYFRHKSSLKEYSNRKSFSIAGDKEYGINYTNIFLKTCSKQQWRNMKKKKHLFLKERVGHTSMWIKNQIKSQIGRSNKEYEDLKLLPS